MAIFLWKDDLASIKGEINLKALALFDEFRNYLLNHDRSEATVKGYLADLRGFETWFEQTNGEELGPQGVTPTDVREYRQYLVMVQQHKANTVNRRLAALSAFMTWAKITGQVDTNPTEFVRGVPQVSGGPHYLDRREQFALQRALEKDLQIARLRYPKRWVSRQRDGSMVTFLLHTGLRLNEALKLRIGDLEISERKGTVIVRQGKGGKQRIVPLNGDARKAVQDWLAVRPQDGSDFIWIAVENEQAGSLSGRSVQRVMHRIGQDAGLKRLTPHVLRHTFGKNLVDSGVGLEKVAALLGHSSLNTTRIYIVPNQQDLEKAVEKLSIAR
jgi:integrase/recombinase XerC